MMYQNTDDDDFELLIASNPEPSCPVVLLLDNSSSMHGERINELNKGIAFFKECVLKDELASLRLEVSIITFGDKPEVIQDFSSIDDFEMIELSTKGYTPMGEAIIMALDRLESRKNRYKKVHLDYFQPWIILITDGEPTDDCELAAARIKENVELKKLYFIPIGVESADMKKLKEISHPGFKPVLLKSTDFRSLFQWLSDSLSQKSVNGEQITSDDFDKWAESIAS
jgi:uncharacterized protein YegL